MHNEPTKKPSEDEQRDPDEIHEDDLESVSGGLTVGTVVTDNKHPEGARRLS